MSDSIPVWQLGLNEWMNENTKKLKKKNSHCLSKAKLHCDADDVLMAHCTAHKLQPKAIVGKHHGICRLLN